MLSFQVFNLSHDSCKVSVVQLVRLDFRPVGLYDSVSDSGADLAYLVLSLVLSLDLLVLVVLSLLSLLSVLIVEAE